MLKLVLITCDMSNTGSQPWILPAFTIGASESESKCLLFVAIWPHSKLNTPMPLLETPSRVWRRIQDAQHVDMPSLPSLPAIDDITDDVDASLFPNSGNAKRAPVDQVDDDLLISLPVQSTPTLPSSRHTYQPPSSRRSSAGQPNSILSQGLHKSTRSTPTVRFADKHESFEISAAATTTSDFSGFHLHGRDTDVDDINSKFINGLALPNVDLSLGLDEALQPAGRSHSPLRRDASSIGLRSDSRVRPFPLFGG